MSGKTDVSVAVVKGNNADNVFGVFVLLFFGGGGSLFPSEGRLTLVPADLQSLLKLWDGFTGRSLNSGGEKELVCTKPFQENNAMSDFPRNRPIKTSISKKKRELEEDGTMSVLA